MLKELMEGTDRCILRYVPDRGWSATDIEGASDDEVTWHKTPPKALAAFTMKLVGIDNTEADLVTSIEERGERWACEWWHGPRCEGTGEWLRPFAISASSSSPRT